MRHNTTAPVQTGTRSYVLLGGLSIVARIVHFAFWLCIGAVTTIGQVWIVVCIAKPMPYPPRSPVASAIVPASDMRWEICTEQHIFRSRITSLIWAEDVAHTDHSIEYEIDSMLNSWSSMLHPRSIGSPDDSTLVVHRTLDFYGWPFRSMYAVADGAFARPAKSQSYIIRLEPNRIIGKQLPTGFGPYLRIFPTKFVTLGFVANCLLFSLISYGVLMLVHFGYKSMRSTFRQNRGLCISCGHNRVGLSHTSTCPECGYEHTGSHGSHA